MVFWALKAIFDVIAGFLVQTETTFECPVRDGEVGMHLLRARSTGPHDPAARSSMGLKHDPLLPGEPGTPVKLKIGDGRVVLEALAHEESGASELLSISTLDLVGVSAFSFGSYRRVHLRSLKPWYPGPDASVSASAGKDEGEDVWDMGVLDEEEGRGGGGASSGGGGDVAEATGSMFPAGVLLRLVWYPRFTKTCCSQVRSDESTRARRPSVPNVARYDGSVAARRGLRDPTPKPLGHRQRMTALVWIHATSKEPESVDRAAKEGIGLARLLQQKAWGVDKEGGTGTMPRRRLLVIINPISGPGQALHLWKTKWAPVLIGDANCDCRVQVTQRAHHATDIIRDVKPDSCEGIITVGGDGLLHEILLGLLARSEWVHMGTHMPVGHLPGGSGNAMIRSAVAAAREEWDDVSPAFLLARGRVERTDLSVHTVRLLDGSEERQLGMLNVGLGIVPDIDFESEILRWMGPDRVDIWGVFRAICLRHIDAQVWIQDARDPETAPGKSEAKDEERCASYPSDEMGPTHQRLPDSIDDDLPEGAGWSALETEANDLLYLCQATHLSYDVSASPCSTFGDGLFWLLRIPRLAVCDCSSVTSLLGFDPAATVARLPGAQLIPIYSYRLIRKGRVPPNPCCCDNIGDGGGSLSIDGEQFWAQSAQGEVIPRAWSFMTGAPWGKPAYVQF